MKSEKIIVCLFLSLFLLISACSDEEGKGDFSGVSDLIADRNKARYEVAEKPSQKKQVTQKRVAGQPATATTRQKTPETKEEISSVVLYEQEIEIIGTESRKSIAKGIAYINKQGQIVRIKILRD
jgi:hypothetical protein